MAVTHTGFLSLPLLGLAKLVADSTTFRTLVGAANQAAALASIFYGLAETNPHSVPTRAIIRHLDALEMELVSPTIQSGNMALVLTFELEIPAAPGGGDSFERKGDEYVWATNRVGAIVSEMATLAANAHATNGYVVMQQVSLGGFGWLDPKESNGLKIIGCEWFVHVPLRL